MQHICGIQFGQSPWLVLVSPHHSLVVEERSRFQSPLRCMTSPPGQVRQMQQTMQRTACRVAYLLAMLDVLRFL